VSCAQAASGVRAASAVAHIRTECLVFIVSLGN
jgi:hypothetical protein